MPLWYVSDLARIWFSAHVHAGCFLERQSRAFTVTVRGQAAAHPDFPLRAFVRCESCGRGLTGSWSKGVDLSTEVALREGPTGG